MKILIFDHILLHLAAFLLMVSQVWVRNVTELISSRQCLLLIVCSSGVLHGALEEAADASQLRVGSHRV